MNDTEVLQKYFLTEGGDTRIELLKDTQANKYFLNPYDFTGLYNRGSCTCSTLNPETKRMLEKREAINVADYSEIRLRLKELLNFEGEDRFDVFLAPSGSDLTYYPLLFAKLLNPDREMISLVSCPEELGSGTIKAATGKYFMTKTQMAQSVPYDQPLYEKPIEAIEYKARGEEGNIITHRDLFKDSISRIKNKTILAFLVVGSKSGIENDTEVIKDVGNKGDVLWIVDLCQFRNRKVLINDLLDQGAMVMLTGSKFYQSPPFCGTLLVPKNLGKRIKRSAIKDIEPFKNIFSRHDIPPEYSELRMQFYDKVNRGLIQRWLCALHEMESYDQLPHEESDGMIDLWNESIKKAIEESEHLVLMPQQEMTNKSIISFRAHKDGVYLKPEEMQALFHHVVTQKHEGFSRYDRIFIGQPVRYGERAFLRLALGSFNVRKLIERGRDLSDDLNVVKIIDRSVTHVS